MINNKLLQRLSTVLVLTSAMLLAACGGSSGGSDTAGSASDDQASDRVTASVSSGLKALSGLADGSSALDTAFNSVGMGGLIDDSGSTGDDDTVDLLVADVDELIRSFFANPVQAGSTITYTPNAATVCDGALMGETVYGPTVAEQAECLQVMQRLSLLQQVTGDASGTLTYLFEGQALVTVGYTPDGIYVEADLAELGAGLLAISQLVDQPADRLQLPTVVEGIVRLTLDVTSTTPGAEAGRITLGIREPINIAGSVDGQDVSVGLAASDTVFSVSADAASNTASLVFDLAAVNAAFPIEDAFQVSYAAALSLAGFTGTASVSGNGDTLSVTGLGLGNGPFRYQIAQQTAIEFDLEDLDLTIDGSSGQINLGTALDLTLAVANIQGLLGSDVFEFAFDPDDANLAGTLTMAAPAGTSLEVVDPDPLVDDDDLLRVASGSVSVDATGYYADPVANLTVNPGQCLEQQDLAPFPLQSVSCP